LGMPAKAAKGGWHQLGMPAKGAKGGWHQFGMVLGTETTTRSSWPDGWERRNRGCCGSVACTTTPLKKWIASSQHWRRSSKGDWGFSLLIHYSSGCCLPLVAWPSRPMGTDSGIGCPPSSPRPKTVFDRYQAPISVPGMNARLRTWQCLPVH